MQAVFHRVHKNLMKKNVVKKSRWSILIPDYVNQIHFSGFEHLWQ